MKKLPLLLLLCALLACNNTPDYVIDKKDMAKLMADIHQANAVVEQNPNIYASDSAKQQLLQSVFAKHGTTEAQFDTSLMWYGHNLDIYKDVYENVVEILEKREKDVVAEARKAGEKATLTGDSIDIWSDAKQLIFNRSQTGSYAELAFSMPADENNRPGDRYEWTLALCNNKNSGKALLGVDYADGTTEYLTKDLEPEKSTRLRFQSDSLQKVNRIFGYMHYEMKDESAVFIDSLMLYRARLSKEQYRSHDRQHLVGK